MFKGYENKVVFAQNILDFNLKILVFVSQQWPQYSDIFDKNSKSIHFI